MKIRLGDIDHCDYVGDARDWLAAHPDAPGETIRAIQSAMATRSRVDFVSAADGCPQYVEPADENQLVLGRQIQHDRSGVGHCWQDIDAADIPADIREEIEGEIIDGGREAVDDFVGSNGLHYRWS